MKKKVLVVDDYEVNIYLLESLLKGKGFDVLSAVNGKDALSKVENFYPDIIISDILMPVMDGYALCRECKSNSTLKDIPFVFYTATYTEKKDELFGLSLGADRFIIKPVEPEILIEVINELLMENSKDHNLNKPLGEEMEYFRQYNEVLFRKLEKKMSDLEKSNKALKESENRIKTLLDEKELLLKEINHRIKNNMSTMMGLLNIQINTLKDPSAINALKDATSRLQSMSILYNKLQYKDDTNKFSVNYYLSSLVDEIIKMFSGSVVVKKKIEIEDFLLSIQILSPIGIIVNEIITNSIKYAFKGMAEGLITVKGNLKDNNVYISIKDNGIGIPDSVDVENSIGFGLNLIEMLMTQLEGTVKINRENGTEFILEFPINNF